jgi:hypothetical protein
MPGLPNSKLAWVTGRSEVSMEIQMVTTGTATEEMIDHGYTKLQVLLLYYFGVKLGLSNYRRNTG